MRSQEEASELHAGNGAVKELQANKRNRGEAGRDKRKQKRTKLIGRANVNDGESSSLVPPFSVSLTAFIFFKWGLIISEQHHLTVCSQLNELLHLCLSAPTNTQTQ